ncbi:hypothetical protein ABZ770_35700 [Streptomyces sp. NPDC006654]|uniref:hypothetical protein n=1 Tax=unclassified Streptomyces TaxID=2593676 RepID=UPI0033E59830
MPVDEWSHDGRAAIRGQNDADGYGGDFTSLNQPGVHVSSGNAPGAEFETDMRGQIRLVPRRVQFYADPQGGDVPDLPAQGQAGEIIAVTRGGDACDSLWVCVEGHKETPVPHTALWAKLQLGPVIGTSQGIPHP